jgi:hypothetical protein
MPGARIAARLLFKEAEFLIELAHPAAAVDKLLLAAGPGWMRLGIYVEIERVWNLVPSVMTTLIMWYLGWISFFMAEASFRRQRCTGFNELSGCGRSYSEREIASQVRRLGPFCLDGGLASHLTW